MNLARLAMVVAAAATAACDGTVHVITGISNGGGTEQRNLSFIQQPAGAAAGEIITPAIQVAARDTLGNTDPNFAGSVTIRLGANPSGAFLSGTTTVGVVGGVASFGNLSVSKPGAGFTLVATAPGAAAVVSSGFAITEPAR